jgi:hypothetical protein
MATKFNWHTYQQQTAVWQAEQRGIAKSRQTAEERARQRVLLAERVTAELEATLIRKAQRRADELEVERSRRMV